MTAVSQPEPKQNRQSDAAAIASQILDRADRDVAFIVCFVGESQYILAHHFRSFIEVQLRERNIDYDDYPFLRPFIEIHARELADFVAEGVGLSHQLGLRSFETLAGDPLRLFRADLWDTLRSHIEDAERHFVSDLGGLQKILTEIKPVPPTRDGGS